MTEPVCRQLTEQELAIARDSGNVARQEIRQALDEQGLKFRRRTPTAPQEPDNG
jgi:hypothetical protein